MCRLTSIIGNMPRKKEFFYTLMLANNAEHQPDGWGCSDGDKLFKNEGNFAHDRTTFSSISELDPNRIFIGHVRQASKSTTAHDPRAAHPFVFLVNGHKLVCAHNGFIPTMYFEDNIESDSYAIFKNLAEQTKENGDLDWDVLENWLQTLGGGKFAFMILYNDTLWIVRNSHRELYSVEGTIDDKEYIVINTSEVALLATIANFYGKVPKAHLIPEGTIYRISSDLNTDERKVAIPDPPKEVKSIHSEWYNDYVLKYKGAL